MPTNGRLHLANLGDDETWPHALLCLETEISTPGPSDYLTASNLPECCRAFKRKVFVGLEFHAPSSSGSPTVPSRAS